jgi:hypothetical protein
MEDFSRLERPKNIARTFIVAWCHSAGAGLVGREKENHRLSELARIRRAIEP